MSVRLTEVDRRIVREVERVVMSTDGPMSKDMADRVVDLVRLRKADRKRRDEEAKGVTSTPTTTPSSTGSRRTCRPKHRSVVVRHRVVDGKVDPKSVRVFKFKAVGR